jgi:outer membrane protein assembly factor BamD (BamD/ComL family)/uncharacterized membrane protein
VGFYRYFCRASTRALIGVVLIASFISSPAYSLDTKDSQLFITGFNAYLKRDYPEAIASLSGVLEQYPDTSLRDMAILWLSRSYYKAGNQKDAARYMAQFFKEYPDSPLKGTVEEELAELARKYQKDEPIATQLAASPAGAPPAAAAASGTIATDRPVAATQDDAARVAAEKGQQERAAAAKAKADRQAAEKAALAKAEADRLEAEKAAQAKVEAERLEAEKAARAKTEADRLEAEKAVLAKAEAERQEAEKAALAKVEADRLEAEKTAQAKAEAERQAEEKAALARAEAKRLESEKIDQAKAEADRQAEKFAQAKAEADRQAAEKAAQARAEADRLEAEKFASAKAEAERQAAEKAALARAEAKRLESEKVDQAKAEADRLEAEKSALARAEAERLAAEKAASAKAEADRLEAERLFFEKSAADRLAAEKLAAARAEAERQEAEKRAVARAEAERLEAEKASLAKAEAERLEVEKLARAKEETERLEAEKAAVAKAEAERQAAERLAQAKPVFVSGFNAYLRGDYPEAIATLSGVLEKYPDTSLRDMTLLWLSRSYYKSGNQQEAGRHMAQFFKDYPESPLKATVEEGLADLAVRYERGEPLAVQQAASPVAAPSVAAAESGLSGADKQLAAQKDEAARVAVEKAARDKAAEEWAAAARVEAERQAAAKRAQAEADRQAAAERSRAKADTERKTVAAAAKPTRAKDLQASLLRDQAIAEYRKVVERYPGTPAAINAANRLRQLDASYQEKAAVVRDSLDQSEENSKIFSIEVDQKASLDFSLAAEAQTVEAGKRFSMPFQVLNRGNSPDSFSLESGIPADYRPRFTAASDPDSPLVKTAPLLPGERFDGLIQFEMPTMSLDGERKLFPVKALSDADGSISQSRPLRLVAKAPILRAVIKSDVTLAAPGERIPYRLALLNVGSAVARDLSLRVTFPPQYEPVDAAASGFSQEGKNTLVFSGLQLTQGDRREIAVTMQLKNSALAKEELFLHVDMINSGLDRTDTFVSAPVAVKTVSGVRMLANVEKITALPGQTVTALLAVTNTGNASDEFTLKPMLANNLNYSFYLDANRDGIRQPGESIISHVGPLAPGEAVNLILEITTSSAEKDGTAVPLQIALDSVGDPTKRASAKLSLVYSRPVLSLTVAGRGGKIRPGEVNSFELVCINAGSSMAKMVEIRSSLPDQLELVADDPGNTIRNNGEYAWRFDELGSGEKRTVRVSYRIKSGTAVGTALALKNILKYQDQLGNSY